VQLLGDAQFDRSPFGAWVFEEAARILSQIPADACAGHNSEYSHAVKYLFQGSCARPVPHRSVLDDPHSRSLAERLVDNTVRFCEQSHSLGTSMITVRGILASNLRAWASSGDVGTFLFHPRSLTSPQFLALIEHARDHSQAKPVARPRKDPEGFTLDPYGSILRFCAAHTPEEFLDWAASHRVRLPLSECHEALQAALTKSKGCPKVESEAPTSSPHCELTYRPGIYVDVFGTIIQHDGTPNLRLITFVRDLMQQTPQRQVFLISDSEDEELTEALKPIGDPLPPLIHKEDLRDHELEILIDNCEPEPQGLHARAYLQPTEAIDAAPRLLKPDGIALAS
jgi:hypothetical protein